MLPSRLEDYLESLFELEIQGETPTVTLLARRLDVTKSAVTLMAKRLMEQGFLEHEHYGGLFLTGRGFAMGLRFYRRHENLSFLFSEMLGIPAKEAEEVACTMEHAMKEESENRLLAFADFFCNAMRGGEKWTSDLRKKLEEPKSLPQPLPLFNQNDKGLIVRITARNPLRERLLAQGFSPDQRVVVEEFLPEMKMKVTVGQVERVISRVEAAVVWARKES
ncbi:MAG: metal-dependent transcriptional regulator [Synergistota bacterium]|nr:metal-dependent transcriptional regulator [Synergistota bacterium]